MNEDMKIDITTEAIINILNNYCDIRRIHIYPFVYSNHDEAPKLLVSFKQYDRICKALESVLVNNNKLSQE